MPDSLGGLVSVVAYKLPYLGARAFQCVVYGSFARLILQLRRDLTVIRTASPHAQTEGAGNVFKEKGQ